MATSRRSPLLARLACLGLLAVALCQLAGVAFLAPAGRTLRGQQQLQLQSAAALAAGAAAIPQPAAAAELTYDGFGPPELVAIFFPIVFVGLGFLEWEGQQTPADEVTGVGFLGKTVDGDPNSPLSYKRRSPEYD